MGTQFDQRRWAVENAEGLGRHLSSWLLARGELVIDVPSTATARVRQLSRGGGRKNDRIDAAAAASVAALQGEGRPLEAEGTTDALALLDESRMNLAQSRVRLVNQLHALLRELLTGGAPTDLSAATAAALLRRVHPAGEVERVRKQIAAGLVTQIRSVDALLKSNAQQISERVAASGSTLTSTVGIGAITAGRLIGRTGRGSCKASAGVLKARVLRGRLLGRATTARRCEYSFCSAVTGWTACARRMAPAPASESPYADHHEGETIKRAKVA